MKKVFMFLMIVMLASLVVACGGNNAQQTPASQPAPASSTASETTAPEANGELVIKHQLGETPVKKNPEKVVVFDFGALDTLDKLGIEVIGVPQASVPPYLSQYEDAKYANVGSLKEPDFETINELQPDLIIISGRQQEMYAELSKIAPTIFLGVDTSRYMESFIENTQTIGQIFDKEEAVEAELAQIDQAIKQLQTKATAEGDKKSLIILANDGKISAYGAGSRFGILHDVFGFAPVDENIEVSTHGQSISFEYIAEKNPDYLFVVDRGAVVAGGESSAKEIVENELVMNTKAYQEQQIVYLDPNYWYLSGGGLISVAEMVKEVEGAVN